MIYRPSKDIAKELRKGKLYRQSALVHLSTKKHEEVYERMRQDPSHSHESDEQVHERAAYYLVWHQHGRQGARWSKRALFGVVLTTAILVVMAGTAHCQIDVIQFQQNSAPVTSFAAPFKMNFAGCTLGRSASTITITCSGGTNTPGGSDKQVQYNSAGSAFGGIAFGTNGQILESCGTNCIPQFQDPIVSGPDAPAASSTKNPVQVAGNDGSVVRAIKTDSSGNVDVVFPSAQHVVVDTAPSTAVTGTFWQATQPVSGTFWQGTQPVSIASMPSTPVTGTFWQATQPVSGTFFQATQPVSGTFWQATQPVSIASMPSTPVTGTFWQATQPVSGTVTANQGTANSTPWNENLTQVSGAVPSQNNALPVQVSSTLPTAGVIPVVVLQSQPPVTATQNALLYRSQLRTYCYQNLSGCAPATGGGSLK